MLYGDQTRLKETHGPSEFKLLLNGRLGEFTLEPAMRSSRTNVMVGFLGSFDRSDGNNFLRNVVLHPTLQ